MVHLKISCWVMGVIRRITLVLVQHIAVIPSGFFYLSDIIEEVAGSENVKALSC